MEDGADEPDGGSFSSELPDRTEEQAPRAPVNGGIRRCRPAPWTRCAAALRECGWRAGRGGAAMPWILELGDRSRAMQDARERLTAAVPGLSPCDDVCLDDLVGVIICDGPSRALLEALREATCTATEVLVVAPRHSGLDPWETLAAGAA